MAKLGDLVVRIGADTRGLNKDLGKVQRQMRGMTGNMQKLGRSITQSVTLPLAGMAALSVRAFQNQAKAIAQVEAGLKSTGNVAGKTSAELQKMASDLQKTTLFGDEDILQNATAQLLTFTNITGQQFDRTQKAALDLATRLDGDLKSASIQLGKALNDPVANLSALSRSGIQFSAEQKEVIKSLAETGRLAEAQTIILDELNKQYGGSAEAAALADGGITQLGNAIGDLGEEIGRIVVRGIAPMIDKLRGMVEGFSNLSEGTKLAIVRLGALAAAFGPVLFFLPQIITQVKLLGLALAANPILAAAGVIVAIGVAMQGLKADTEKAKDSIDDLRNSFAELDDTSKKQKREDVANTIKQLFRYKKLREKLKEIEQEYRGQFGETNKVVRATREFKESLSDADKAILSNTGKIIEQEQGYIGMRDIIALTDDTIITYQNTLAALTENTNENTEAVQKQSDTIGQLFTRLESVTVQTQEAHMTMGEFFSFLENTKAYEVAQTGMQAVEESADNMQQSIAQAFGSAASTAESFAEGLVDVARQIIKQYLAIGVAKALASGNVVQAASLSVGAGLLNRIQVPALAQGGLAYGPTMAMVGDNKNAAIDPEVVAPLSKLKDMMGGGVVEVVGRIKGDDIFLSNARSNSARNRYA